MDLHTSHSGAVYKVKSTLEGKQKLPEAPENKDIECQEKLPHTFVVEISGASFKVLGRPKLHSHFL
jgi:hypothetical protein